jgi:hypothetical protein
MTTRELLVLVGAIIVAACGDSSISRAAAKGGADQIAEEMVKALNNSHIGRSASHPPDGESGARAAFTHKAFTTATEITGEVFTPNQAVFAEVRIRPGLDSRQPLGPDAMATYISRLGEIGKTNTERWIAAEGADAAQASPALTLIFIANREYLFDGPNWKPGQPARALTRRGSIPKVALDKWTELVAKRGDRLDDPLTILLVDGLFVDSTFQQDAFDAAIVAAEKLLRPR